MISSQSRFRRAIPGLVAFVVAGALVPPAWSDILFTGNGASAGVNTFDQTAVQSGSTPALIDARTAVNYTNYDMNNNASPGSVTATVIASAVANPGTANLLQLNTMFWAPDPGRFAGPTDPWTGILENAYWGNLTAKVDPQAGSPMPSSIRLEFQVNYAHSDIDRSMGLGIPSAYVSLTGSPMIPLPAAGSVMQFGEAPAKTQSNGSLTASFHLNVPLSSSGVSISPFALGLSAAFPGILNNSASSINDAMSVSLTGIYLPDGTSLTADGYGVTFHSVAGPIQFETVPEPATWTAWSVIAGFGALMLRHRRTRTG